ncbi:MAG: MarR family transcriptional regulator [Devosiaceae bacterium]|nr:MarR family transcriptional regulator [Devosiaceae bacterium MH13]
MPDTDNPDLFRLFNEIAIINQLATTAFERVMPHGLTLAQFSVLNHLSTRDPQAPAKMASAFQVSKGTMTSTVGRLEAKGFVEISPNPKDARGKFVGITDAGRTARGDAIAQLGPTFAWLGGELAAPEVDQIIVQLTEVRKLLDARRDNGA